MARVRVRPWMVVAGLSVVGIVGASLVFVAAQAQHRTDRADIARWQRLYLPVADDAADTTSGLSDLTTTAQIRAARARLETDRARLLGGRLPDIVRPVTARFLEAINGALLAVNKRDGTDGTVVSAADSAFIASWNAAKSRFARARADFADLVCRAELPACVAH